MFDMWILTSIVVAGAVVIDQIVNCIHVPMLRVVFIKQEKNKRRTRIGDIEIYVDLYVQTL